MWKPGIIICLFYLTACTPFIDQVHVQNLNANKISLFGHGGLGIDHLKPYDSKASILACINLGSDGCEMNIQMTADGKLVSFHDADLNKRTSCEGMIHEITFAKIATCSFSKNHPIASIEEILNDIPNLDQQIITFDCKLYGISDTASQRDFAMEIDAIASQFNLGNRLFVESQDSAFLRIVQQVNPSLPLFIYPQNFENGMEIAEKMTLYGITISVRDISAEQVQQAHDAGLRITLWNTNSRQSNKDALLKSPDYIQTDMMKYLLHLAGR